MSLESRDEMKPVAPQHQTQSQAMQRVRVGMVGLAAVILLIGLASALFSAANRETPVAVTAPKTEAVTSTPVANTTAVPDADNEPLAQLGVAPSASESSPVPEGSPQ